MINLALAKVRKSAAKITFIFVPKYTKAIKNCFDFLHLTRYIHFCEKMK